MILTLLLSYMLIVIMCLLLTDIDAHDSDYALIVIPFVNILVLLMLVGDWLADKENFIGYIKNLQKFIKMKK